MLQCPACGSRNADGAQFCSNCGATISGTQPLQPMQAPANAMKPVPLVKTVTPLAQVPMQFAPPMTVTQMSIGACSYHRELPASYICVKCGKAICSSCTKPYGQLAFCPQCYWSFAPRGSMSPQAPSR